MNQDAVLRQPKLLHKILNVFFILAIINGSLSISFFIYGYSIFSVYEKSIFIVLSTGILVFMTIKELRIKDLLRRLWINLFTLVTVLLLFLCMAMSYYFKIT
jgi:uncharacterized membrane protein